MLKKAFYILGGILLASYLIPLSYCSAANADSSEPPYYGFTPFPYDSTIDALTKTDSITRNNSTLYAIHLDECIPWNKLLTGQVLPTYKQEEWDFLSSNIPSGRKVYVGLSFLGTDRETLAPVCGQQKDTFDSFPSTISNTKFNSQSVKKAYLNYVRKAIKQFRPAFLNLGIEVERIAHHFPARWVQFEELYSYILAEVRKDYPQIKVAVSFALQAMLDTRVANRAKPLIEQSDFFCMSFYPYASAFHEKLGAPALRKGQRSWIEPLKWIRNFTKKPIAVCETGYSTQNITVKKYNLKMSGSKLDQESYLNHLLSTAIKDNYLFVVWFLAVDYDKLYEKMPQGGETEINLMWKNIGFFDGNLNPKPAWKVWQKFVNNKQGVNQISNSTKLAPGTPGKIKVSAKPINKDNHLGFNDGSELFTCGSGSKSSISNSGPNTNSNSMLWEINYNGQWQWCMKDLAPGKLSGKQNISLWVKGESNGYIILNVEEKGGEAFFKVITITPSWQKISIDLKSIEVESGKKQNGILEVEMIKSLLFADASGDTKSSGTQKVWIAEMNSN